MIIRQNTGRCNIQWFYTTQHCPCVLLYLLFWTNQIVDINSISSTDCLTDHTHTLTYLLTLASTAVSRGRMDFDKSYILWKVWSLANSYPVPVPSWLSRRLLACVVCCGCWLLVDCCWLVISSWPFPPLFDQFALICAVCPFGQFLRICSYLCHFLPVLSILSIFEIVRKFCSLQSFSLHCKHFLTAFYCLL